MKMRLDIDEWYPVYSLDDDIRDDPTWGIIVDVSDEFFAEYQRVFKEFNAMQTKLMDRKTNFNLE